MGIWGVSPKSILHVGAHLGEESSSYDEAKWAENGNVIWVEAQTELVESLKRKFESSNKRNLVLQAAVWDSSGKDVDLRITNNTQATSLLLPGTLQKDYPEIHLEKTVKMKTIRLDQLIRDFECPDFLNLDIQGAEFQALVGLGDLTNKMKWIYTEVNSQAVYKDSILVDEIDRYLLSFNFKRVATVWVPNRGWGDALYFRDFDEICVFSRILMSLKFRSWKSSQELKKLVRDLRNSISKRFRK